MLGHISVFWLFLCTFFDTHLHPRHAPIHGFHARRLTVPGVRLTLRFTDSVARSLLDISRSPSH